MEGLLGLSLRDKRVQDLLETSIASTLKSYADSDKSGEESRVEPAVLQFNGGATYCERYSAMFSYIVTFLRWTREGPFYCKGEMVEKMRSGVIRLLWWLQEFFP